MNLRINLKTQLQTVRYSIINLIAFFIIWMLLGFEYRAAIVFFGAFVFMHIPVVYLHWIYLRENFSCELKILEDKLVFQNLRLQTSETFSIRDIENIELFMAANRYNEGFYFLPHLSYYFATFVMRSGKEFNITCLMSTNLFRDIQTINGVRVKWDKTFFARI